MATTTLNQSPGRRPRPSTCTAIIARPCASCARSTPSTAVYSSEAHDDARKAIAVTAHLTARLAWSLCALAVILAAVHLLLLSISGPPPESTSFGVLGGILL